VPTVGLANSALGREPNGVRFGSAAWRLCMIGNLTSYLCRDYPPDTRGGRSEVRMPKAGSQRLTRYEQLPEYGIWCPATIVRYPLFSLTFLSFLFVLHSSSEVTSALHMWHFPYALERVVDSHSSLTGCPCPSVPQQERPSNARDEHS
jgi:hypothetical protein